MRLRVLITGFGPFSGAPFNPSGPLALALAQRRRPALANVERIAHVFPTSYAAVARDLPPLVARHAPGVVLMFGLATRTKCLRIEMQARNATSLLHPDVGGALAQQNVIAAGAPSRLRARTPVMPLAVLARAAFPTQPSRDAGRYLCNYAYWLALEQATNTNMLVQFVHIPPLRRALPRHRVKRRAPAMADLIKAGEAILIALISATRR